MILKKAGVLLIILGILGCILSLFAGYFGIGDIEIQAMQWLGAQIGAIMALLGIAMVIAHQNNSVQIFEKLKHIQSLIVDQPVLIWTFAGFLATYLIFFIAPVFFDSRLQFHYLEGYLPVGGRLGLDLRAITDYLNLWLLEGKSPYSDHIIFYPPLYNILFAPITLLVYPQSYYLILCLSILAYFGYTWTLPVLLSSRKKYALLILFFVTGIFSYGLQFELERGQFNVIAFFFCLLAIYIFHHHKNYRFFAYLFFSLAVQLKVSPFIFILMFITDWRDWKANIKRVVGIGLFNFSLLFVLGYSMFVDYINSTMAQVIYKSTWVWLGNHSIKAFVSLLGTSGKNGLGVQNEAILNWARQDAGLIEGLLFSYAMFCLLLIVVFLYLRREKGFNPYLLLACTIVSLLISPASNDYKLAILAAPMYIAFSHLKQFEKTWKKLLAGGLIFYAAFVYSLTLYSFKYRPGFLANSMPFLFVILTIITILYLLSQKYTETNQEMFA